MWKRTIWFLATALLVVAVACLSLFWRAAGIGESGVEQWVGSQLQSVVAARGKFVLRFDTLDYQYPMTVVVDRLRFDRADVSTKPILDVERATVELAEIPRRDRPIVIRSIRLDRPTVHLDALVKKDRPTTRPVDRPELSALLTLKQVLVREGRLDYDDGTGQPLSWTQLNADLTLEAQDAAWHRINLAVDQAPLMRLAIDGELDLDRVAVRGLSLKAAFDLTDPAGVAFFTAPLQRLLEKHEVHGQCSVDVTGNASWTDRPSSDLRATLILRAGSAAAGQFRFAIDQLEAHASLRGNVASVESLSASLLGGATRGDAKLLLEGPQVFTGQLTATGLQLDQLVRRQKSAKQTLAGEAEAHLLLETTLPDLRKLKLPEGNQIVWGSGHLRVHKGRLINLPVINDVFVVTRKVTNLVTGGDDYRDRLDMAFKLAGKRFDCTELVYRGDAIAIRGHGDFYFNGNVDLALNAGPLERLQEQLGGIGRLWGKLTDGVMTYLVTGSIRSPQVQPVLGGR